MDMIEIVEEIFRLLEQQQKVRNAMMTPENAAASELRAERIKDLVVGIVDHRHRTRDPDRSGGARV
jgi:hypothetical protein